MNHQKSPKPSHVYIGRMPVCGCCVFLISDEMDDKKVVGKEVGDAIADGLNVTRVEWGEYISISNEVGFMNCPHVPRQLKLLED